RELTFTRAIGVIVLRNLPAGRGRHVVVAGAALLVTSASANTGLLLFRLSLHLLIGRLLADLLAGLIARFSLLLPRLSGLTRLAVLLSLLFSFRLTLLLRPLQLQRLHAGVRLALLTLLIVLLDLLLLALLLSDLAGRLLHLLGRLLHLLAGLLLPLHFLLLLAQRLSGVLQRLLRGFHIPVAQRLG